MNSYEELRDAVSRSIAAEKLNPQPPLWLWLHPIAANELSAEIGQLKPTSEVS